MVNESFVLYTNTFDPWYNLSVEEYLLDRVQPGQFILYLWQNQNTVVIGKNQNAWRECRTELLEAEGGKLARRLSGGGAVFHDTGNLNFTFLMGKEDYNLHRQVSVILEAVKSLGIHAEMTGRNDITVDGRKFSGNAFCFRKKGAYHHGTVLISADMPKLAKYLQVSKEKIRSKGIESVQSRVVNLNEYNPGLTIDEVAQALISQFKAEYGECKVLQDTSWMDKNELDNLYKKYSSWEWRYGEAPKFDIDMEARFPWGGVEFGLKIENARVTKANVYSDALEPEFIEALPQAVNSCAFNSKTMAGCLRGMKSEGQWDTMLEDLAQWLEEKGF